MIAAGSYAKAAADAKAGNDASKEYARAQELYEKVLKFDPKRDDAYYSIGMSKIPGLPRK